MSSWTKEQLNNAKRIVIQAYVDHELGNRLNISDKVYDNLLAQLKQEDPSFNIHEFTRNFTGSEDYVPHRAGMEDLEKEYTHDIAGEWKYEDGHHKLPKYDGSSIVVYYTAGKLSHILSMRDKYEGIDQTEKFRDFVPDSVLPAISFIRCECVVDVDVDDNPRGKANGLVNSKYLQEEVQDKCTLMAFCCHDLNGDMMPFEEFVKLSQYNKFREDGRPYFMRSPEVQEFTLMDGVAIYSDKSAQFKVAVDGIVYYGENYARKYDYINSRISKVLSINWAETERELLFPTVSIEPVELEGTIVKNPSSNGVRNIINMGIVEGCEVEVIKSGMTIPKIIGVLNPGEVVYPTCPHCGYQMSEDDVFGNGLKCGNRDCEGKYKTRHDAMMKWIEDSGIEEVKKQMTKDAESNFFWFLNVSRFNYESSRNNIIWHYIYSSDCCREKVTTEFPQEAIELIKKRPENYEEQEKIDDWATKVYDSISPTVVTNYQKELIRLLNQDDYEAFEKWIGESYYWTDLQWNEAWLNLPTTFKVFRELYK